MHIARRSLQTFFQGNREVAQAGQVQMERMGRLNVAEEAIFLEACAAAKGDDQRLLGLVVTGATNEKGHAADRTLVQLALVLLEEVAELRGDLIVAVVAAVLAGHDQHVHRVDGQRVCALRDLADDVGELCMEVLNARHYSEHSVAQTTHGHNTVAQDALRRLRGGAQGVDALAERAASLGLFRFHHLHRVGEEVESHPAAAGTAGIVHNSTRGKVHQIVSFLVNLAQVQLNGSDLVIRIVAQRGDENVPEHHIRVDELLDLLHPVAVADGVAGSQRGDNRLVQALGTSLRGHLQLIDEQQIGRERDVTVSGLAQLGELCHMHLNLACVKLVAHSNRQWNVRALDGAKVRHRSDLLDDRKHQSVLGLDVDMRATQQQDVLQFVDVVLAQLVDHICKGHVVEQLLYFEISLKQFRQLGDDDLIQGEEIRLHDGPQIGGLSDKSCTGGHRSSLSRTLQSQQNQHSGVLDVNMVRGGARLVLQLDG
mmetsp:Transcript_15372/g.27089  ORF Transcript_15372/g.27089 Transcript_15372/m.27089 type:complete len:483 (-) Transcript_15372:2622-4070(-)